MKINSLLLLLLAFVSFTVRSQLGLVPDTLLLFPVSNNAQTIDIGTNFLLANDTTNSYMEFQSVWINSSNSVQISTHTWLEYNIVANFQGVDTIWYSAYDPSTTTTYDTSFIVVYCNMYFQEQLKNGLLEASVSHYSLFRNRNLPSMGEPNKPKTMFAANLWFMGKKDVHFVAVNRRYGDFNYTPREMERPDNYVAGPVGAKKMENHQYYGRWERVWKVTRDEIDSHMVHWSSSSYTTPTSILNWPGNGDVANGEPIKVAPFVDLNSNGLYEPQQGEYPEVKGDEAVFFVYHGASQVSTFASKIEIQGLMYSFHCANEALRNSFFVDYKLINRGTIDITEAYVGMFSDFDVGAGTDDYVATDVNRSLVYAYNADDYDDNASIGIGFGYYPPAQGVLTLKGPLLDSDSLDNSFGPLVGESTNGSGFGDGVVDNERWGLHSSSFSEINASHLLFSNYNCLKGLDMWGNPHVDVSGGNQIAYRHLFSGTSDSLFYGSNGQSYNGSSEEQLGVAGGQRFGLSSSGQFTFSAGDTIDLTYAFVRGHDELNQGAQAGIIKMLANVDAIQTMYNNQQLVPCGFPAHVPEAAHKSNWDIQVFPNPTNHVITIESDYKIKQVQVFNVSGQQFTIQGSTNNQYDLSNLPDGMYLFRITSAKGLKTVKVLKH